MNLEEYKAKMIEIDEEAEQRRNLLAKEYALANNPIKEGDIVEDHIGRVLVDKIKVYLSNPPHCVYYGVELTKAGKPFKNGNRRGAHQSNLKT